LSFKRCFDVILTVPAIIVLLPVYAIITFGVRASIGSPVLFNQNRPGLGGKPFKIYKFRTMTDIQGKNGECLPDAQRLTRFGAFLRKTSIDELPELFNVLKGDMSLVGPRPHPLDDYQQYHLEHLRRLDVTPGVTGLWQVTARRDSSFQKNMDLDLEYIAQWNLWMDLRILCQTMRVVVMGNGT